MILGYTRVSKGEVQDTRMQETALRTAGVERISTERSMAGLQAARARDRKGGRRPRLTPDQAKLAAKMLDDLTNRVNDILAAFHVPRSTLYRAAQPFRKRPSAQEPTRAP
jgi:DNA invertase Pin-like site-specific DNA recombinase